MNTTDLEPEESELATLRQIVEWVAFELPPLTDAFDRLHRQEGGIRLTYIHDLESPKALAIYEAQKKIFTALSKGILPSHALGVDEIEPCNYHPDIPDFRFIAEVSGIQAVNEDLWQYDRIYWSDSSFTYDNPIPSALAGGRFGMTWFRAKHIWVDTAKMYEVFPPTRKDNKERIETRGRKRKYDWDSFYVEVARIANLPDGLPETQADLEKTMAEWCSLKWGEEPATSMIRDKISAIYQSLKKAENK